MKTLIKYSTIALLFSCELVIDVETPEFKPTLVVGSTLIPDSTITVAIGRDKYILDNSYGFRGIGDAQVRIYENDILLAELMEVETTDFDGQNVRGIYGTSAVASAGNTYRLEVAKEGFTSISSTERIPTGVPEFEVTEIDTLVGEFGNSELSFKLRLDDQPGPDYYQLIVRSSYLIQGTTLDPATGDYTKDTIFLVDEQAYLESENLIFEDHISDLLIFDDNLFDGRPYDMSLTGYFYIMENDDFDNEARLYFELRKISEAYFNYFNTSSLQNWVSGDPFAEPVQVYTNIENGRGFLGSYVSETLEIDLD